jgi:hypothetical protein
MVSIKFTSYITQRHAIFKTNDCESSQPKVEIILRLAVSSSTLPLKFANSNPRPALHMFISSGKGFSVFFPVTLMHKSLLSPFIGEDNLYNI